MKSRLLLVICAFILSQPAFAQPLGCTQCTLGLYDEPEMQHTFGEIVPFTVKDIYLGITYATPETALQGIEFSISGLHFPSSNILVASVQGVTPISPTIILGSVAAPPDTSSTSTGTGGMNIAWGQCVVGSQALAKITLLAVAPISNHVLRVMHRFPPSNPTWSLAGPVMVRCDDPTFTAVRIAGGQYVLGGVVPVEGETWSRMKGLYR